MRTAHSADHGTTCMDARTLTYPIGPRPSRIDDPACLDMLLSSGQQVAHQHPLGASVSNIYRQNLGMIPHHRSSFGSLNQPFRHQSLRKLTLRIFKAEY